MFGFKKKQKAEAPALPALKLPTADEESVILSQETDLPDELPPLEDKPRVNIPEKIELDVPVEKKEMPVQKMQGKKETFIKSESHNIIVSAFDDASNIAEDIDTDISNSVSVLEARNSKTDALQHNLEEVSKKLIDAERMIFGG